VSRPALWLLVALSLLLPAAARAAGINEDLTPDEIRKQFKKITSEFSEIERAKRSTAFHFNQLEANVRELSAKLDSLDTRLKTFETAIESIRAEFAKMAKARIEESKAARPATPSGPSAPAAVQEIIARVEDDRHTIEGTFLTFTGTVVNLTARPLTFAVVRVTLLDQGGNVIKTESTFTSPQIIPPQGKATYRIVTRRDNRIASSTVTVRAD
jgi:outer membrane murein-binding lipoprotein Lpp